jgi:hypothetical protein
LDLLPLVGSFRPQDRIFFIVEVSEVCDEVLKGSVQQTGEFHREERIHLCQPEELSLVFAEHLESVPTAFQTDSVLASELLQELDAGTNLHFQPQQIVGKAETVVGKMLAGVFVQLSGASEHSLQLQDPALLLVGAVVCAKWAEHKDAESTWCFACAVGCVTICQERQHAFFADLSGPLFRDCLHLS